MKIPNKGLRLLAISALIAVVLVSGCISGDSKRISVGYGQDALLLEIDTEGRDTFDDNEDFTITVSAENIGEFNAENVKAKLLGYDGITSTGSIVLSDLRAISPENLDAPDAEKGVTGGVGYQDWEVNSPSLSAGTPDREVALTADVYYDYKSLASQKVVAVTREYLNRIEAEGGEVPTSSEVTTVNGPISVNIESPVPHVKLSGDTAKFYIKVVLSNDGSGSVKNYNTSLGMDYLNEVNLRVPVGLDIDLTDCDFTNTTNAHDTSIERLLKIGESYNPAKLRLTQGGLTRTLNCRLIANSSHVGEFNTYTFNVESSYTYIQEITKPLLVENVQ